VASNLTVITSTAAGVIAKGLNGQGTPQVKPDVFAALLGETRKPADPPAKPTTTSTERAAAASEPPKSNADQDQADDPQAVAAPIDAVAPVQTTPPPAELKDVLDRLAKLSASIEAGKAPTEQDMADLATALDALAQALGVSLDDLPSTTELTALANSAAGTSATDQLAKALAPLALSLQGGDAATGVAADADLTLQLTEMGNKLAALAKALSAGDVAPDSLAALGMDKANTEIDPDLQAALDKLAARTAIKVETAANAQPLATPELKLTEPAITGKTTEAKTTEVKTEPATEPAAKTDIETAAKPVTGDKPKSDTDSQPGDGKPHERDVKVAAAPVAPAPDKQPDQAALPQQQTARIDPLLTPRVVQTGYQTSQQQLNLPQLAFEVARQASDGNTRFQIRLDPAELGRIDVRLDIDASGRVNARLTVEKAETLDLMQRDQRGLERALQQAGLDGAKTNLEFSLKQNPFNGGQQGEHGNGRPSLFGAGETTAEADETPAPTINLYRGSLSASGVNILA
jgi:flagellar hook-length control protein FliK